MERLRTGLLSMALPSRQLPGSPSLSRLSFFAQAGKVVADVAH